MLRGSTRGPEAYPGPCRTASSESPRAFVPSTLLKGVSFEMNLPSEPVPGPMPVPCNTSPKPKIVRFEYSRTTNAECAMAWRIFADCQRWHRFSDAYRSFVWHGSPWVPGSRLQIEIVTPVVATQDRVITL